MRRRMRECVTWAFERNRDGFETRVEFELQVRRAQRTAQRYIDWLLAQEREAPFEVLGREVPAELELDGRPSSASSTASIATSAPATSASSTTRRAASRPARRSTATRCAASRDFQLPFYYWARTAAGDRVTKLVLIPLKDALLDVRPIVVRASAETIAPSTISSARARNDRAERASSHRATSRTSTTTQDAVAVHFLRYATACANKPPPEAAAFRKLIALELTAEQRAAVEAPLDGCFAILGAAGTGKSTALARARCARARALSRTRSR